MIFHSWFLKAEFKKLIKKSVPPELPPVRLDPRRTP